MHLGIDVGGTHTDGALVDERFALVRTAKVPTRPGDVLASVRAALEPLLDGLDPGKVRRLVVSSTLGLNAILTGRADPVGVLAIGGPGLRPDLSAAPHAALLSGAQDHRGEALAAPTLREAEAAAARLADDGAKAFAVISKFGPKNPAFETLMAEAVQSAAPGRPLTRASALAGRLNFPRRLQTAVYNSAVMNLYRRFVADLSEAAGAAGLAAPISLLTADGGTLPLAEAAEKPVLALAAGPAAGLLGLWSLAGLSGDALMADIGGTSTDLAVMVDGRPLMTAEGLDIAGRPTLVRSFLTHSIALGGDSDLAFQDGTVTVGPARRGPALALTPGDLGRRPPTLTDALNVLNPASIGDPEVSRQALAELAAAPPEETARRALAAAMTMLKSAATDLLRRVNSRPVYTVDAVRLARPVRPARAALLGGPAEALAGAVAEALSLPVTVPPEARVANAVGAARSRPALTAELYADTALGLMTIPTLNLRRPVDRGYSLPEAEADLLAALAQAAAGRPGAGPPQITEAESFNQLSGRGRADKIIRLRAQTAPGVAGL